MSQDDRMKDMLDQAEDAYFEVLMQAYAEHIGEKYLEESKRLNADPSFEYPEESYQKCLALIERAGKKDKSKRVRQGMKRFAKVAAVVFIVIVLSGTLLFTTVEAFRVETLSFLVKTFLHTEGTSVKAMEASIDKLEFLWEPDDWKLVSVEHGKGVDIYTYNRDGRSFVLESFDARGSISIDTESAQTGYLEFGTYQAFFSEKSGYSSLTWIDYEEKNNYTLSSEELTVDELLALANSFYQ